MSIPTDEADLAALFERHGARDPQAWAASQVHEGINKLHRFMFLKQAWSTWGRSRWEPGERTTAPASTKRPDQQGVLRRVRLALLHCPQSVCPAQTTVDRQC